MSRSASVQGTSSNSTSAGTAIPEGAQGDNVARRVAVYAGYDGLPAATINRFCASSLQATLLCMP